MPKDQHRPARRAHAAPAPRVADERRVRPADDLATAPPPKPTRSQAMLLAAEVDRLQQELIATRAQLADLAARVDFDPLLEIFNRRSFERELARSLAYVKRYDSSAALIYLDLDNFKRINDRHGHAAGDAVLKAVVTVLTRRVRASDIVARIGGDEFAVLLWHLNEASAHGKALALEEEIGRIAVDHGEATLSIGVSAGVAMLGPLETPADVMERADRAMYARKAARRTDRR
jgi:diguanylate cyclase (GGDEF)-like protein